MAVQPQEEAALSVERSEARFPILADIEHAVADAYGVYNHFSDSEAAASVFIISKDGGIIWENIATYQSQRVPSQTILENLPGAEEAKTEQPAALLTPPNEPAAETQNIENTTLETHVLMFGTNEEIEGASATLTISEDGYDLSINTTGLTVGHAATAWWAIYNTPKECSDGVCDHNDDSNASFSYADGQVVDENGSAIFESHKSIFEVKDGAEIQFMIRDHGPMIPELADDQLSKPGGGCTNFPPNEGPNECEDVQKGIFAQS